MAHVYDLPSACTCDHKCQHNCHLKNSNPYGSLIVENIPWWCLRRIWCWISGTPCHPWSADPCCPSDPSWRVWINSCSSSTSGSGFWFFKLFCFQTIETKWTSLFVFQIRARYLQNWKARAAKICRQPNNKIYASLSNLDESRASFAEPKLERSMKIRAPLSLSSSLGQPFFPEMFRPYYFPFI